MSAERISLFVSLKVPAYQAFYGALVGHMACVNMQMVARSWFIYELKSRTSILGLVALAHALPILALSLFGGVIADRVRKKTVLIIGQLASSLVALTVAVSITLGAVTWVHLIVAAFFQGIIMALMMPSRQAIIPELVDESLLMNAISINAATMNLFRLVAPALAGFLIALWSIESVYYIMTGLYFISFLFTLKIPSVRVSAEMLESSPIADLTAGLRYLRRNTTVFSILVFTLMITVLSMPYFYLLPVFSKDIMILTHGDIKPFIQLPLVGDLIAALTESSARLGLLISISGIGAIAGSLWVASRPNKHRGLLYLLSVLVLSVTLIFFSLTTNYLLALAIFIPLGLGQAGRMSLSNTLVQSYTERAYRGRMVSVYMMEWGLTSFGVFLIGIIAEFIGVRLAVGGGACLLLVITLYYFFMTPRIRQLD
ncbi:MAG: MFS transporter [Desulfobacterales bacterium]